MQTSRTPKYNHYINVKLSASPVDTSLETVYIGLGGNLGDVKSAIKRAVQILSDEPIMHLVAMSGLYRTAPVGGPPGQPDYVNAAARFETSLAPEALLARCLDVEQQLGRVRDRHWGPRTIDLDVLLFGERVIDTPKLRVPHPRLRERLFALAPLRDAAPGDLALPPDGKKLSDVIRDAALSAGATIEDFTKASRISGLDGT